MLESKFKKKLYKYKEILNTEIERNNGLETINSNL